MLPPSLDMIPTSNLHSDSTPTRMDVIVRYRSDYKSVLPSSRHVPVWRVNIPPRQDNLISDRKDLLRRDRKRNHSRKPRSVKEGSKDASLTASTPPPPAFIKNCKSYQNRMEDVEDLFFRWDDQDEISVIPPIPVVEEKRVMKPSAHMMRGASTRLMRPLVNMEKDVVDIEDFDQMFESLSIDDPEFDDVLLPKNILYLRQAKNRKIKATLNKQRSGDRMSRSKRSGHERKGNFFDMSESRWIYETNKAAGGEKYHRKSKHPNSDRKLIKKKIKSKTQKYSADLREARKREAMRKICTEAGISDFDFDDEKSYEPENLDKISRIRKSFMDMIPTSSDGVREEIMRLYELCMETFKHAKDFISIDFETLLTKDTTTFRMFLSIFTYVYQLVRSKNALDYAAATTAFILTNGFGSIIDVMSQVQESLVNALVRAGLFSSKVVTESFMESVSTFQAFMVSVMNSDVIIALRDMILVMASYKWFSKDVATSMFSYMGKPKAMPILEVLQMTFSNMVTMLKAGISVKKGVPICSALFAANPKQKAMIDSQELLAMKDYLYAGLPVEGMMDQVEFISKAKVLIAFYKSILPTLNPLRAETKTIRETLLLLQNAEREVIGLVSRGNRPMPFGLIITGPPGIGKSKIVMQACYLWSKAKGRAHSVSHVYTRIASSDYWECYQPYSHPIIRFSEVASQTKARAKMGGDTVLEEITSLIDTLSFPCNTAFGDKGKVFARPELVVMDTNNDSLNLNETNYAPAAARRRFLFVEPKVKPMYRKLGCEEIDPEKALTAPFPMHVWTFTAWYMDAQGNHNSNKRIICEGVEIDEYTSIMYLEYTEHIARQRNIHEIFSAEDTFSRHDPVVESEIDYVRNPRAFIIPIIKVLFFTTTETVSWAMTTFIYSVLCLVWYTFHMIGKLKWIDSEFTTSYITPRKVAFVTVVGGYLIVGYAAFFCLLLTYIVIDRTKVTWFIASKVLERVTRDTKLAALSKYVALKTKWNNTNFSDVMEDPYWKDVLKNLALAVSALGIISAIVKYAYRTKTVTEGHSNLRMQTDVNSSLNALEEVMGCGTSYKRIPVHNSELWNRQELIKKTTHVGTPQHMFTFLARNMRKVVIRQSNGKKIDTYLLGVCQNIAIINRHPFGPLEVPAKVSVSENGRCDELNIAWKETLIYKEDLIDIGDDLALVRLNAMNFKDLRKHIAIDLDFGSSEYVGKIANYDVIPKYMDKPLVMQDPLMGKITIKSHFEYIWHEHKPGFCGLPLIIQRDSGCCVVGLHCAGEVETHSSFAAPFTIDMVNRGIARFNTEYRSSIISEGNLYRGFTEDPLMKSPFRYEVLHGLNYVGKLPGKVMINTTSRVVKSVFASEMEHMFKSRLNFERTISFAPPLMKPVTRHDEYISPYNLGLRKMAVTKKALDPRIMDVIVERLYRRLRQGLLDRSIPKLAPITMESAINGLLKDFYTRRLNAHTSGGYGYPGKKSDYLPIVSELDCIREPVPDLKARVVDIIAKYRRGETCGFVYTAKLKDEPREVSKVLKGATRLFYMSALDNLIVARMFLAPFYSLMVQFGDLFCTSVGINMYSGADEFVKKLDAWSEFIMEGDYGKFDQTIPFDISIAVKTIIEKILREFGYNEEAMSVVKGLLTDDLFPWILMNLDLFGIPGLQPSGKFGTAESNSLKGLLLMMYAWYMHEDLSDKDFFEYVLICTYGDDVLGGVKGEVISSFNNNYYQKVCKDTYGMDFTSASKDSMMVDHLDIHSVSYLKRKFVYRPELNRWLAPLDMNSMLRSVTWTLPSQAVAPMKQSTDTCASLLWEMFMHVEITTFNEVRDDVMHILHNKFGSTLDELNNILPTYHYIRDSICGADDTARIPVFTESNVREELGSSVDVEGYLASPNTECHVTKLKIDTQCWLRPRIELVSTPSPYKGHAEEKQEYYKRERVIEPYRSLEELRTHYMNLDRALDLDPLMVEYTSNRSIQSLQTGVLFRNKLTNKRHVREHVDTLVKRANYEATIDSLGKAIERRRFQDRHIISESNEMSSGAIEKNLEVVQGNLTDVVGESIDSQDAGESKYPEAVKDSIVDMQDFLSRPIPITDFSLAVATDLSVELDVLNMWSMNAAVRSKLRNWAYLRGTLVVRVSISGTPFHSGRVLLSAQPSPMRNENVQRHETALGFSALWRPMYLAYMSQSPGARSMNVCDNKPVDIRLPFISTKPMYRLFNSDAAVISTVTPYSDMEDAWSVYLYTLNQVNSVSATPSNISFYVYAWMEDVELSCPTATQVGIVTESNVQDERKVGPIEAISSSAAIVAGKLSEIPVIAPLAMASRIALQGLSGISAIFGWSRPILDSRPTIVKNNPYSNGCVTIGPETNYKITFDPHQELTVDPRVLGSGEDEMSLAYLSKVWSYIDTFAWNDDSAIMTTPIYTVGVHPYQHTTAVVTAITYAQPSALAFAATPFAYWKATIKFRFEIVCSQFHRGKLAVIFEPNVHQATVINAALSTNKQYIKVIDIQETQTVDFCVQWAFHRSWAQAVPSALVENGAITTYAAIADCLNGYLSVVPINALQSPDNSDIQINVYVSADDLQVNLLSPVNLPSDRQVVTESQVTDDVSCMNINESVNVDPNCAVNHFGERILTFRSALKRYVPTFAAAFIAGPGLKAIVMDANIIPLNNLLYGAVAPRTDLFSYMRYAYVGVRGSVSKRIRYSTDTQVRTTACAVVTLLGIEPDTANAVVLSATRRDPDMYGGVMFMPDSNGGIEVSLPFYSENLFAYSFADDLVGFQRTGDMEPEWVRRYESSIEMFDNAAGKVIEFSSAGEDFMFMRFQGAPFHRMV